MQEGKKYFCGKQNLYGYMVDESVFPIGLTVN